MQQKLCHRMGGKYKALIFLVPFLICLYFHLSNRIWFREKTRSLLSSGQKQPQIVFIKTFKTGSTSVAELIFQIARKLGLYMLHPRENGKFDQEEIQDVADKGLKFDVSFRHFHPAPLDYSALEKIFPDATYVTILRHPVQFFFSMFKFDDRINRLYKDDPQWLINDFAKNKLWDKRKWFCNTQAHIVYSDEAAVEKRQFSDPEALAQDIIDELESHNVVVMIQEHMSASLVHMSNEVGLDLVQMGIQMPVSRKQRYNYKRKCGFQCEEQIKHCAKVDMLIYDYFRNKFVHRILPDLDEGSVQDIEKNEKRNKRDKNPYSHNCVKQPRSKIEEIQSCNGKP